MPCSGRLLFAALVLLGPLMLTASSTPAWSVYETARDNTHRLSPIAGPASAAVAATALQSVAFANPDGSVVAVVLNESDLAVSFPLSIAGEAVACSIPAHAIQTYVRPIK